jgi:hypothetical protein
VKEEGIEGQVEYVREMDDACKILVGNPEGKRHSCGWEENIQMDLKGFGYEAMDLIQLAQDRNSGGICKHACTFCVLYRAGNLLMGEVTVCPRRHASQS